LDELVRFETTTDTTGQIPVSITVTGGTLVFRNFLMNYTGSIRTRQATDPNTPIDPDNPSTYIWTYGIRTLFEYTGLTHDLCWADPNINTVKSDGVSNLTKNGQPWEWRVNVGDNLGDWTYPIHDGETVTFDFFVDPENILVPI
jgi:hypothetical protein